MLPTFDHTHTPCNIIFCEKVTKRLGKIQTGDVVILRGPTMPEFILAKRVVGVEGDEVTYLLKDSNQQASVVVIIPSQPSYSFSFTLILSDFYY